MRAQGNGAGKSCVQPGEGSEEAIRDRDKSRQVVWEGGKRKDSPVPSCSLDLAVCLVLSPMQTVVLGVFYSSSRLLWVALSDRVRGSRTPRMLCFWIVFMPYGLKSLSWGFTGIGKYLFPVLNWSHFLSRRLWTNP